MEFRAEGRFVHESAGRVGVGWFVYNLQRVQVRASTTSRTGHRSWQSFKIKRREVNVGEKRGGGERSERERKVEVIESG